MPFDERRHQVCGQVQRGRSGGHGQAPQVQPGVGCARAKPGQALVAAGVPIGCGSAGVHALATQAAAGGLHGRAGTAQAQVQGVGPGIVHPATGVERQRLAAPGLQAAQRVGLAAFKAQRGLGRGHGQHFEADFGEHPELPPTARHEARDVVPGHVLHHLAAKVQVLAQAVDHAHAQHVVAHTARTGARRAREAGGHHAAHGAAAGKAWGLEGQVLALLRKHLLQLGQRRARAHGHHQLGGFVVDDAVVGARVQQLAQRQAAHALFGAPAANAQRGLARVGGAHLVDEGLQGLVHGGEWYAPGPRRAWPARAPGHEFSAQGG